MSGLVAVLHKRPRTAGPVDTRLAAGVAYRGPRGVVVWGDDRLELAEAVGDVRRSTQPEPLVAAEGLRGPVIAVDAHLAERRQLRQSLNAAGVAAATRDSDRTLVRLAVVCWGDAFLEHLTGEFVVVVWHPDRGVLTVATDQLAARQVFYADLPDRLVVGTELVQVATLAGRRTHVDDGAVAQFLLLGSVRRKNDASTAFSGVRRLLPAERLDWSPAGVRVRRYWSVPSDIPMQRRKDPREYAREFRSLLAEVVQDRLEDVDAAVVHLSGGMDSTAVAAVAMQLQRDGRVQTRLSGLCAGYTVLAPDDEPYYAGLTARHIGLPFGFVNGDDYGLTRPLTVRAEPASDFATGFSAAIGAAGAAEAPLVLSGKGGDELLPPTPLYRVLLEQRPVEAVRLYRWLWKLNGTRPPLGGYRQMLRAIAGRPTVDAGAPPLPMGDWIDPDFARGVDLQARWEELFSHGEDARLHPTQPDVLAHFARAKWAIREELVPSGAAFPDATMPFADQRLVRFSLGLPPGLWSRRKQLLREAMAGDLPGEVLIRRKTPAPPYAQRLLARPEAAWVDSWEGSAALARYVRRDRVPPVFAAADVRTAVVDTGPLFLDAWLRQVAT